MKNLLREMSLFILLPLTCLAFRMTTGLARFTYRVAGEDWDHG